MEMTRRDGLKKLRLPKGIDAGLNPVRDSRGPFSSRLQSLCAEHIAPRHPDAISGPQSIALASASDFAGCDPEASADAQGAASGSPQYALRMIIIMNTTKTYEKASAATAEATDLIKTSCSTALKGAHDYNNKLLEFAQTNADIAFGFAHELMGVKSPSELMQLSTEHARQQFGTLTEQATELAALGQKLAYATTEPLKTGVAKAFSRAA
jgi:phasin